MKLKLESEIAEKNFRSSKLEHLINVIYTIGRYILRYLASNYV